MKLGGFIIGLLAIGLIVSTVIIYYANIADTYDQTFDSSEYDAYSQSESLDEQIADMNVTLNDLSQPDTAGDSFVTTFLGGGWKALKTTFKSFGVFRTMADTTLDKAELGDSTSNFKNYLIAMALVTFFLILIGVIVGRDLI